LVIPQNYFIT
jgi:hypothetical protein